MLNELVVRATRPRMLFLALYFKWKVSYVAVFSIIFRLYVDISHFQDIKIYLTS